MADVVRYERRDAIGVITIDNPPVNAVSHAVRAGLLSALERAQSDTEAEAVVLRCAGRTFIAGADISEFDKPLSEPDLPTVIERLENMPKPVVAAVHGTALGGGLETALACHYRCALASAKLGLPEVLLGLLAGASGTQRLPRLIGVKPALDMMISGKPVNASRAKDMGIIDELLEGDLLESALAYAQRLVAAKAPVRRVRDMSVNTEGIDERFFAEYRSAMANRTRGYFAPERIVQCVEAAVELPFDEGLRRERRLFLECKATTHSKALRYLFFAEREVAKIPDVAKDTPRRAIERLGIVGAGTMGGGIAMSFADAGLPVSVLEADEDALENGLAVVRRNYEKSVARGRLSAEELRARMELISGTLDMDRLQDADLVIEAVFEDMDLKKSVFSRLDQTCKPGAILATNTSTLDIDEIAAVTSRPQDVIGLHFFSPANVMPLLEIVRARETAKDVIATALAEAKRIGKIGVVVGNCWGFVGNRMFAQMLRECQLMELEGVPPERIDQVAYDWGMAMGPNAVLDLAGLDVDYKVRMARPDRPSEAWYFRVGDKLCELGRLGQKTGKGFYRYEEQSRTPVPDPEVREIIRAEADRLGIAPREIGDAEIIERLFYPLINEGARILAEAKVVRAGDIDVIWTNGYGFPRYRGGPMFYADTIGAEAVRAALLEYAGRYGEKFWQPAPLLQQLADAGGSFASWRPAAAPGRLD